MQVFLRDRSIDKTKIMSVLCYMTIVGWLAALLLQGKENSMLKKIVEEAGEFTFAVKDKDIEEIIYEAADLTYHVMVALASCDVNPDRIKQELNKRFSLSGIEEKNSREKS